jgi:hypothetical protein
MTAITATAVESVPPAKPLPRLVTITLLKANLPQVCIQQRRASLGLIGMV